jgi:hypothetical protein
MVWRVSFAIAGVTGILAILLLVRALTASGDPVVARVLRLAALPMYALMTFVAVTPGLLSGTSGTMSGLRLEAILFCLVVLLSAQVAWAAAMSTDPDARPRLGSHRAPHGSPAEPADGGLARKS